MSQISQKSISGITSITSPAGIDNQFTLHTNDTSQAAKLDSAGNFHFSNHVNTTGITSASNFKTGSSNLHSTGLTVGDTFVHSTGVNASSLDIDDFISIGSNIHFGNAGVITATSFVGSGAALTGIDATSIKDSGGNVKIQAQASGAIHSGVSTFQDINVDGHTNLDNVSIAGVTTAQAFQATTGTFTGDVDIASTLCHSGDTDTKITFATNTIKFDTNTEERLRIASTGNVTINKDLDVDGHTNLDNVSIAGVVTATSYRGDGSNLTGIEAGQEVYGFTGIGNSLSLTTTNNGADNIDNATYVAFEENFIGPSGISFSINTSGNLIMSV